MKKALRKKIFVLICLLGGLLATEGLAQAGLKIKLAVEPFVNDSAYKGTLELGSIFPRLIQDELKSFPNYQVVRYDKIAVKPTSENDPMIPKYPGQAAIKGRILKFIPNVVGSNQKNQAQEAFAEKAEFKIELEIFDSRTGGLISRESLETVNSDGTLPFNASAGGEAGIMKTSIGKAMAEVARKTLTLIQPLADQITFEARVLSVDMEKNKILINAGRDDGIGLLDVFRIYEIDSKMKDPWSGERLGEIQIPLGTVKIKQVFENVSEGYILAGDKFEPGNLARLKWNNYIRNSGTLSSGKRAAAPWWDFYGALALGK